MLDRFVIALIVIVGGITGVVLYEIFSSEQKISDTMIPKLSEEQIVLIVRSDLSKHLPNLDKVIIIGKDPIPDNPNYPKSPLRLIYENQDGIQYSINTTDYSPIWKCDPEKRYCAIPDEPRIQMIKNKMVYMVGTLWSTKTHVDSVADYIIDAQNGSILYSSLTENIPYNSQNEYKP